jgi:hypothetical protein
MRAINGTAVPLIVGLWNAAGDLDRARQRLEAAGATRVVTSFAGCLSMLEGAQAFLAPPAPAGSVTPAATQTRAAAAREPIGADVSTWNA